MKNSDLAAENRRRTVGAVSLFWMVTRAESIRKGVLPEGSPGLEVKSSGPDSKSLVLHPKEKAPGVGMGASSMTYRINIAGSCRRQGSYSPRVPVDDQVPLSNNAAPVVAELSVHMDQVLSCM
jgi:hypothetical protein